MNIWTAKSGKEWDLSNPKVESVDWEDIGNGLDKICRFNGQVTEFYSVAQHCLLVAELVKFELAHVPNFYQNTIELHALLHDAGEAIIGDISTPMKKHIANITSWHSVVEKIEQDVLRVIYKKAQLEKPSSFVEKIIFRADQRALWIEDRILRAGRLGGQGWEIGKEELNAFGRVALMGEGTWLGRVVALIALQ